MVRFHCGSGVVAAAIKIQPESNPPAKGSQGELKDDCVTLWFPGTPLNWKVMTEPLVAFIELGMNWNIPPEVVCSAPTATV